MKRKAATDDGDGTAGDGGGYLNHSMAYAFVKKQDEERRKNRMKSVAKARARKASTNQTEVSAIQPTKPRRRAV